MLKGSIRKSLCYSQSVNGYCNLKEFRPTFIDNVKIIDFYYELDDTKYLKIVISNFFSWYSWDHTNKQLPKHFFPIISLAIGSQLPGLRLTDDFTGLAHLEVDGPFVLLFYGAIRLIKAIVKQNNSMWQLRMAFVSDCNLHFSKGI